MRKIVPYARRVRLEPTGEQLPPWLWSFTVVLSAFWSVGGIGAGLELARSHVAARVQFGKPLASFQGVQNQIADVVIQQRGLQELARYTLSRLEQLHEDADIDALLLRSHHLDVIRKANKLLNQLHGAVGFCYEYPLLAHLLASQYERQLPITAPDCITQLIDRYREIDVHYETLKPAWPLQRSDLMVASSRA